MNQFKEHIVYKFSTAILILALLTPSAVKFFHIFEDHIHEVCKNNQKTHFHKVDLDCEFYKFKLNTQFVFSHNKLQFTNKTENYQPIVLQQQFLSDYQNLHFSSRGPPQLI